MAGSQLPSNLKGIECRQNGHNFSCIKYFLSKSRTRIDAVKCLSFACPGVPASEDSEATEASDLGCDPLLDLESTFLSSCPDECRSVVSLFQSVDLSRPPPDPAELFSLLEQEEEERRREVQVLPRRHGQGRHCKNDCFREGEEREREEICPRGRLRSAPLSRLIMRLL